MGPNIINFLMVQNAFTKLLQVVDHITNISLLTCHHLFPFALTVRLSIAVLVLECFSFDIVIRIGLDTFIVSLSLPGRASPGAWQLGN